MPRCCLDLPRLAKTTDTPPSRCHPLQVIADLFQTAAPSGSFGSPPHLLRDEYSRVCIANASLAGSGECSRVKAGSYRIHVPGFSLPGAGKCDNTPYHTNFVKAHVDAEHQFSVWGNVGH